jgi:hypothetical protein
MQNAQMAQDPPGGGGLLARDDFDRGARMQPGRRRIGEAKDHAAFEGYVADTGA